LLYEGDSVKYVLLTKVKNSNERETKREGGCMRKVKVVPYEQDWGYLFQEEVKAIKRTLQKEYPIYHIGSTAIPDMPAKPIIDLLMVVDDLDEMCEEAQKLEEVGYQSLGEHNIQGRRFFIKGGEERSHHLHVFQKGNKQIERHVAFREFMIANKEEAEQYGCLKQELANKYPIDIEKYMEGKNAFIKEIDKKAERWIKEADKS
jgi:GrpB-like predicted nucleotidyltransferase (UPF0157 family)